MIMSGPEARAPARLPGPLLSFLFAREKSMIMSGPGGPRSGKTLKPAQGRNGQEQGSWTVW